MKKRVDDYILPPGLVASAPVLGEGLSRPRPGAKTHLYQLMVSFPGEMPMKTYLRAETAAKAKLYASKRWPHAKIIILKK
jgi:hypothetical protein